MHRIFLALALGVICVRGTAARAAVDAPQLVSAKKIWDHAGHNAFTDLIRFDEKWFCTFREADGHVGSNGKIRVLDSPDGETWNSIAQLSEEGVDLRDPKLSITPNKRLMLLMGGSIYEGKNLKELQSRVAFASDGRNWAAPRRVLDKGDWLWRVTWHQGRAYGIAYNTTKQEPAQTGQLDWTVKLVESADGVAFRLLTVLDVPGRPNEATVRFLANDDCVALVRREGVSGKAEVGSIGVSSAPYKAWRWQPAGMQIGGPNFIVLPDGAMVASGRQYNASPVRPKTFVGRMTLNEVKPDLILTSGGDCSYPGMVWHEGMLWLSYYSSHEGKANIYLAKVRLP